MSASKTHFGGGRRLSFFGGLARRRGLVSADAATATKERRPRWAGRATSVIRPAGAGALVAAGGRLVSRSMRAPALPAHSMEGLTFSGSQLQGGGHLAAGVRDPTAPAGCVAGWRWTCPRFGEALHHITRVEVLGWSDSARYRPRRRPPHRGVRRDQAALCLNAVM